MKVWYLPLEPYEERYTAQLADWTVNRLSQHKVDFEVILGCDDQPSSEVKTGVALDAHGRTIWGLTQTAFLIENLRQGNVKHDDVIYMQDLYQPGYDALCYVLHQQFPDKAKRPRIFTHNLAQTIDPDDFTHGWQWMRSFEHMVDQTCAGVFYASTEHKLLADVAGFTAPGHVVGLLHDREAVRHLWWNTASEVGPDEGPKPLDKRTKRIVYTSRFDREKQPHFFMDVAERLHAALKDEGFKIAILTSARRLRSNDASAVRRAYGLAEKDVIDLHEGLTKAQYYALLADSRLQINTARQDWVSNTLLESSALGTPTLAPAYRGFPEALFNNAKCLFVPWSVDNAYWRARHLLTNPPDPDFIAAPSLLHHGTLDRVIDVMGVAAS